MESVAYEIAVSRHWGCIYQSNCGGENVVRIAHCLAVLIAVPAFLFGADRKISPDLGSKSANEFINVIIQYKHQPTAIHERQIAARGGKVLQHLDLIKARLARIPAGRLAEFERDDEVKYISPDRAVAAHLNNATAAVNTPYAWNMGLNGSGIAVAVIDSGIHQHDDLLTILLGLLGIDLGYSRVVYDADLTGEDLGPDDAYGHGTHVAGIIGGSGFESSCGNCDESLKGIAPDVNLVNLRVLDENGNGTDSGVINAISAALQLQSQYNIGVINLSLGRPVFESYTQDPLDQAVEAAWNAGIVVVVAAGNGGRDAPTNGYGTIDAPGNDPSVITVGAMNTMGTPTRADDVMTSYSSKGPTMGDAILKPDLVAPGNRVVSLQQPAGTLETGYPGNIPPISYYKKTSSSNP
ncbi:MAG: S8 family serine peptidase, partial [Terriglobales bacterium]